ncbi:LysE/ArgO family amino acid transporter [Rhodococcus sp. NPDC058521]|uniref:LysE/ArgO family amino acid transporter n=1 Tax=Rhodococcus sp. NPDC058521 TaxID=3346536 RepID=UPI00364A6568
MGTLATGFGTGLSLIVAIGAQNAFVLRQGIARRHVFAVVFVCALSDMVLIVVGISGIAVILEQAPGVIPVVRWAGAAFLVVYGILAARRALRPNAMDAQSSTAGPSLGAAVLTCLALTWLNPHVYLDTVLMLGSVANQHGDNGRWLFGVGAILASLVWFGALGYGARSLHGLFTKPRAWQVLDGLIAAVMITLGALLVRGG